MKNISLIFNVVLTVAVAILFYLQFKKPATPAAAIIAPTSIQGAGVKIAYVNADTLDAQYEWLKTQKAALNQRLASAENSMQSKQEALQNDFMKLQEKAQTGNFPRADLEKEAEQLEARRIKLAEEAGRLERQLGEDQKKAINDLYANVEVKLKELQSQIGYDYILSYTRGGQILLANDSLDITKQVLQLLNAKK
ncbi:MAG: OmpH family outer membrane protein [Saprospiraceae bacterium]|nr:OmpH family outer membrane protein [Saprospiraceae bacterium]